MHICLNSCWPAGLVNFLHLRGLVSSSFHLLKRRQVVIVTQALVIIIDAETQLDHTVDATSKLCGFIKVESRGEEGSVEQEPDQIFHSLVGFVCSSLLPELSHDGVLRVDLHGLLGDHVGSHGVVTQSLSLHDTLHVCRPSILGGGQYARRISHAARTMTFSTLSPKTSFMSFVRGSNSAFNSSIFFFSSSSSMSRPSLVVLFNFLPSNSFS